MMFEYSDTQNDDEDVQDDDALESDSDKKPETSKRSPDTNDKQENDSDDNEKYNELNPSQILYNQQQEKESLLTRMSGDIAMPASPPTQSQSSSSSSTANTNYIHGETIPETQNHFCDRKVTGTDLNRHKLGLNTNGDRLDMICLGMFITIIFYIYQSILLEVYLKK